MTAAADAIVAGWASIAPEDRADLITRLITRGVIRRCNSGGYSIDLGDGFPTWRPDVRAVGTFLFGPDGAAGETHITSDFRD